MRLPKIKGKLALLLTVGLLFTVPCHAEIPAASPIRRHKNSEKKIALSFDDGPHPRYTETILDILKEHEIKATFFVIGCNCERYPEVLKRTAGEGHELGNHTYSHPQLKSIGYDACMKELSHTEEILTNLVNYRPRLFRPPEGVYSEAVSVSTQKLGYLPVLWTVDTKDWKGTSRDGIVNTVLSEIDVGCIILCHDYVSGKYNTPDALRVLIPELKARGYVFVTVSELLESR